MSLLGFAHMIKHSLIPTVTVWDDDKGHLGRSIAFEFLRQLESRQKNVDVIEKPSGSFFSSPHVANRRPQ